MLTADFGFRLFKYQRLTSQKYPFEFAKTRVQLRSQSGQPVPRNPFLVVRNVLRNEGARALYKGCTSLMVVSTFGLDRPFSTRRMETHNSFQYLNVHHDLDLTLPP